MTPTAEIVEALVERPPYIAEVLKANADKFTVPEHIPAKVDTIRRAAQTLSILMERERVMREALTIIHDKFVRDNEQGYHTKDKTFAIEIARSALSQPNTVSSR